MVLLSEIEVKTNLKQQELLALLSENKIKPKICFGNDGSCLGPAVTVEEHDALFWIIRSYTSTKRNSTQMTPSNLNQFFANRPALSKSEIAREAGVSVRLLDYILEGKRKLTPATADKIRPVMVRYGWE